MRGGSIAAVLAALVVAGPASAAPQHVLYVGDSLGVGTTPGLARELGSSAQVHGDSRIGRPSSEGLRVLSQAISPADQVVVFDLGTNDDPAQPAALARDLAAARRVTGNRCLIVATLNRPPLGGVSVDGLNQAVLAFSSAAKNVQLVDWNAIAQSEPGVLGPDHVHPTAQGYAMRAQLFAQAVASCGSQPPSTPDTLATPAPARRRPKPRPRKRKHQIKVPGIESSGISFTEPLRFRGLNAQLLLPNTKPPYPAVVMLGGTQTAAEFFAAHGIATLTYRERRGSGGAAARAASVDPARVADARAAVALLAKRDDVRRRGIGVWAFGTASDRAAQAAAGNPRVAAMVAMSPTVMPEAERRDWSARSNVDAPAVTKWLRLRARTDAELRADPAADWSRVSSPLLAIWGTRDDRMPIRTSAAGLQRALERSGNRDRTFRAFNATHGGAVVYRGGAPVYAPGLLEETARWLGLHLGEKRAQPVIHTPLPPPNPGPKAADAANASALYTAPVQALWLLAPALMLAFAAARTRGAAAAARRPRATRTPLIGAAIAGIACFACIAGGVAIALQARGPITELAGIPWPFALAFAFAAALAVAAGALARRHAWLAVAACAAWLALAVFWLV